MKYMLGLLFSISFSISASAAVPSSACLYDRNREGAIECMGSKPDYCQSELRFANSPACINSKPSYCFNNKALVNALACIGTNPTYCQNDKEFANSLACARSNPSYCQNDKGLSNTLACAGSKPSYCLGDLHQATSLACMDFANSFIVDTLKSGKYDLSVELRRILMSSDAKDVQTYETIRNNVGSF